MVKEGLDMRIINGYSVFSYFTENIGILAFCTVLVIFAIVLFVVSIKANITDYTVNYEGHTILISNKMSSCSLFVDDVLVDQLKSYVLFSTARLTGKVEDKEIKVNIGQGLIKIKYTMFIDGKKVL